jgi:probable LLM family oxidoreductase
MVSHTQLPPSPEAIELGLDTFGDITLGRDGRPVSHAQALRQVVLEGVLADRVGVNVFGVGEHHRPDFAVSAPEVVLAAIASQTTRIHLGSAVTVLSSDDPVRVFQRFSTLDAVSNGRAEVILGRGSFTESFPLFGYELSQYNELFSEKVDLFVQLLKQQPVTWQGRTRAGLANQMVYPPVARPPLKTWIGVGGTPESVVRAARYGLPLTLAIIGGSPRRFAPLVDLYHRALAAAAAESGPESGAVKPALVLPVAAHSPGHVAATDQQAKDELWPHYSTMINRIGRERGWPPVTRDHFEREAGPDGALCVGSPDTVAEKIAATMKILGLSRFGMKYSHGTLPHETLMQSIELFGTQVAPGVRERLAVTPMR